MTATSSAHKIATEMQGHMVNISFLALRSQINLNISKHTRLCPGLVLTGIWKSSADQKHYDKHPKRDLRHDPHKRLPHVWCSAGAVANMQLQKYWWGELRLRNVNMPLPFGMFLSVIVWHLLHGHCYSCSPWNSRNQELATIELDVRQQLKVVYTRPVEWHRQSKYYYGVQGKNRGKLRSITNCLEGRNVQMENHSPFELRGRRVRWMWKLNKFCFLKLLNQSWKRIHRFAKRKRCLLESMKVTMQEMLNEFDLPRSPQKA